MACAPLVNLAVLSANESGLVLWSAHRQAVHQELDAWRPEPESVAVDDDVDGPGEGGAGAGRGHRHGRRRRVGGGGGARRPP